MKKFTLFLTLALLLASVSAQAQVRFGVRAGLADSEPMIGGELIVPMTGDFVFNPNIELTSELANLSADFHYDIDLTSTSALWLGAGGAFVKPDDGDAEFGINLLGGYGVQRGRYYPYAQVRLTSAGDQADYATIAVGLRF